MAKRFTDTDKWKKEWFRSLPSKAKCAWNYLCDNCDHAGIWPIDIALLNFQIGEKFTLESLVEFFEDRVLVLPDKKLWIKSFVEFQYGKLNPSNNAHRSVIMLLSKANLLDDELNPISGANEGLVSPLGGAQDKDQDKDKDLDKDQDLDKEGGLGETKYKPDLEALYRMYPLKKGKEAGMAKLKTVVKTPADFESVSLAIARYKADLKKNGTEAAFIKHFSTFMSSWRDWLDPDTGTAEQFAPKNGVVPIDYSKIFGEAS